MSRYLTTSRTPRRDRQQPMLSFVELDLRALCEQLRQAHFPTLEEAPPVYFIQRSTLANITRDRRQRWSICIHAILNSPDTPLYVFTNILKHELLHTQIRPSEIDGRLVAHPPEFFERERQIAPEIEEAKDWLFRELADRLRVRPRLERIDVLAAKRCIPLHRR